MQIIYDSKVRTKVPGTLQTQGSSSTLPDDMALQTWNLPTIQAGVEWLWALQFDKEHALNGIRKNSESKC